MGVLPRHLADDLQCIGTPSRPHEGELGCGQGWVDGPGAGEGWEEEAAGLVPCCPAALASASCFPTSCKVDQSVHGSGEDSGLSPWSSIGLALFPPTL